MSQVPLQEFQAVQTACENFRAENWRLRERVASAEGVMQEMIQVAANADAEIKRLQGIIENMREIRTTRAIQQRVPPTTKEEAEERKLPKP